MSARQPEPPCNHWDYLAGTIDAGDINDTSTPFMSVATCRDCITKSAGYLQLMTGLTAGPFVSYEEYRAMRAAL